MCLQYRRLDNLSECFAAPPFCSRENSFSRWSLGAVGVLIDPTLRSQLIWLVSGGRAVMSTRVRHSAVQRCCRRSCWLQAVVDDIRPRGFGAVAHRNDGRWPNGWAYRFLYIGRSRTRANFVWARLGARLGSLIRRSSLGMGLNWYIYSQLSLDLFSCVSFYLNRENVKDRKVT